MSDNDRYDERDRWDYSSGGPHDTWSDIRYDYTSGGPVPYTHDDPEWDNLG